MTKKTVSYSNLRLLSILGLICVLLVSLMVVVACGEDEEEEAVTYTLTIAVSPSVGGTTSPAVGTHTYDEGDVVTITATAATGYEFVNWSGAATATTATTSVTMSSNKTVTANFEEEAAVEYTLTMAKVGNGTITPAAGTSTHDEGTTVTITADPDDGWRFDGWTGDVAGADALSTTVTMDEDQEVTATFIQTFVLTMVVDPVASGTTSPAVGADNTYDKDEVVPISATPASACWQFDGWTGDVAAADATSVTMDAAKTVTANFIQLGNVTLTMAVDDASHGSTSPAVGEHEYACGTVVDIIATAETGWEFASWTGDVAAPTSASTTVTVYAAKTVTANFVAAEEPAALPGVGSEWVYDVTYGAETTVWTRTVTGMLDAGAVLVAAHDTGATHFDDWLLAADSYAIETAFSAPPIRVASGATVTVTGADSWNSVATLDPVAVLAGVNMFGFPLATYIDDTYTGDHGAPLSVGNTWSYTELVRLDPPMEPNSEKGYEVEVVAKENITTAAGTFSCYKIEYTLVEEDGEAVTPVLEKTEWWSNTVSGVVKSINYTGYAVEETQELASYTLV